MAVRLSAAQVSVDPSREIARGVYQGAAVARSASTMSTGHRRHEMLLVA
jgi:hypothetical protein